MALIFCVLQIATSFYERSWHVHIMLCVHESVREVWVSERELNSYRKPGEKRVRRRNRNFDSPFLKSGRHSLDFRLIDDSRILWRYLYIKTGVSCVHVVHGSSLKILFQAIGHQSFAILLFTLCCV
jgi:hypothetical protein